MRANKVQIMNEGKWEGHLTQDSGNYFARVDAKIFN